MMEAFYSFYGGGSSSARGARYKWNWDRFNPKSPNAWWKGNTGRPIWGGWKRGDFKSPAQVGREFNRRKGDFQSKAYRETYRSVRTARGTRNLSQQSAKHLTNIIAGIAVIWVSQGRSNYIDKGLAAALDYATGRAGRFLPYKDKVKNKQYLRVMAKKFAKQEGWI